MASMTIRSPYWGLMALLSACAGTPTQVNSVARSDLGCDDIEISQIADNRYAASGCGRAGVYAKVCKGEGCTWARLRSATAGKISKTGPGQRSYSRQRVESSRDLLFHRATKGADAQRFLFFRSP